MLSMRFLFDRSHLFGLADHSKKYNAKVSVLTSDLKNGLVFRAEVIRIFNCNTGAVISTLTNSQTIILSPLRALKGLLTGRSSHSTNQQRG